MAMDDAPGSVTERQSTYLLALAQKKDLSSDKLNDQQREYLLGGDYSAMSKLKASNAIGLLLKLNDKPVAVDHDARRLPPGSTTTEEVDYKPAVVYEPNDNRLPPVRVAENNARQTAVDKLTALEEKVDAGYYFIVNPQLANGKAHDPNDGERFYHVSKPEPPSKWAGRVFIESRGGDFLYKVRDINARIAIIEEILKDPITAMNEYGIRLGVCGCCGRTLTAKDSRLRGLGPICAARILGAPSEEQLAMLDRLGLRKN
jgi:hypothetical protein